MSDKNDDRAGRPARPSVPPFRGAPSAPRGPATPSQGARPTQAPFAPAGQKAAGGTSRVTPGRQTPVGSESALEAATGAGDSDADARLPKPDVPPAQPAQSESAVVDAASDDFALPAPPLPPWETARTAAEYDASPPLLPHDAAGAPENPDAITYSAHGDDDAAAIETTDAGASPDADASPSTGMSRGGGASPDADDSPPWREGTHADVYSDGTFSADAAGSWDQAAVGDSHGGAGRERVAEEPNGAADALESVARRIRAGELILPNAGASAMDEAAALATALSALLGARR